MPRLTELRPALPILVGASIMLTMAMGLRQSLGILAPPLTRDIGISVGDFTTALAVKNLVWGLVQPFAGAVVVRLGFRPMMIAGSLLYIVGLSLLATSHQLWSVVLGAGVAIGVALAATGSAIAMAAASKPVGAHLRSFVLGAVSAAGSLGALIAAPLGQAVVQTSGWRMGVVAFIVLALAMLPAAWSAGKVDAWTSSGHAPSGDQSARQAIVEALRYPPFVVMSLAYAVCGMQLIFLLTHLPTYLAICGMDPMLSAQALGLIGGFNVLGSLFFGWAGGRFNKLVLLGLIYVVRSLGFICYFYTLPTVETTLGFAAFMGFFWLGVAPLTQGWIAETFGLRWQAMISGITFFGHQLGSFVGAIGGGRLYDMLGNYTLAWKFGASMGLIVGLIQIGYALLSKRRPPRLAM